MCTAISYKTNDHYFGRNLDYEHGFGEKIIVTPRNYPLKFKLHPDMEIHYALIGMAVEANGYPLYFDATNEHGLSMAGLNFPDNAYYFDAKEHPDGITPFELIPWLLGQCKTVAQCRPLLEKLTIVNIPFSAQYPLSPLHWIVTDKSCSVVIESTSAGLQIYENPIGVLTNNPPFHYHLYNLNNYINVTAQEPDNRFAPSEKIQAYSRGMGGIGLPGDNSSASRFIRAAFTKLNSRCSDQEEASVTQFFHILNTVCQVDGCTCVGDAFEKTLYSSCCNTDKGIYYYTTYENPQITAVNMHNYDLTHSNLHCISLNRTLQIINSL